jgi:hypothetical protein
VEGKKRGEVARKGRDLMFRGCIGFAVVSFIVTSCSSNLEKNMNQQQEFDKRVYEKAVNEINTYAQKQLERPMDKQSRGVSEKQTLIEHYENNAGGKLKGSGAFVINTCLDGEKIDPDLVLSIAKHESANGTSRAINELNNPGGLMHPRTGKLWSFSNTREGFGVMIQTLKNYKKKGLVTISQIQKLYCPIGAKNDPTGLNQYWLSGVTNNYKNLKKQGS